ncbi:MAG: PspA/IM30 family protein [Planctomycetota bacterium]|jgi:phage shock protein A
MGRINRLKLITKSRIEAFLSSVEEPEILLPQLIREMAEKVNEAAKAEAKALSAVKADRRRLDAANGRVSRYEKGAILAIKTDDIETARQAIAAQIKAEREADQCRRSLAISDSAYNNAGIVRHQLQKNLRELKEKKKDILTRDKAAQKMKAFRESLTTYSSGDSDSILDVVSRLEMKTEQAEAEIEIQDEITQTLGLTFPHERVMELESNTEVDHRLEQLRNKILGQS